MGTERLRTKIEEQQAVYQALKAGDSGTVCYKEFQSGEWGTDDQNYTNRLRLAYYLLYCHIEDEEAVAFLFGEELKDRERNSFQGIGSTLEILTHLIRKYNGDGKYAGLLERAKNAILTVPAAMTRTDRWRMTLGQIACWTVSICAGK